MNANLDVTKDIEGNLADKYSKINKKLLSRTRNISRLSVISSSKKRNIVNINDINKRNFDIFHDTNNKDSRILAGFFNEVIKDNLENLQTIYLENFGFLIPNASWSIDYSSKDDKIKMRNSQVLNISFEKCLLLNTYFKDKYNPIEFKKILKNLSKDKYEVLNNYELNDILLYATSFISTLKYEVITNGISNLLEIGTLYSIHNRQGDSFKDWYSGADIIFRQKLQKTYLIKEEHEYLKPIYNDALEVFEAAYGNCVAKIDINLRKELVMLGFDVKDVQELKESVLQVYVYEDRSLSEKGLVTLYYVTNSLRKYGIKEYGVGTEFVFAVALDESDFRSKNNEIDIPLWPKKAIVSSFLMLEREELRSENTGVIVKFNTPLSEFNRETFDGMIISDFESLKSVQIAKDGNFYYKNILGVTKGELEFANKFSVEYVLELLKERNLHQITRIKRRSVTEKTERLG